VKDGSQQLNILQNSTLEEFVLPQWQINSSSSDDL
jgi:hypothetical protein